jgi:hypothetical protein
MNCRDIDDSILAETFRCRFIEPASAASAP